MNEAGSVLCVANFPSSTGYAWWLMENFWVNLSEIAADLGGRTFVAYPEIDEVTATISSSKLTPVELTVPGALVPQRGMKELKRFVWANGVRTVYLTDRPYLSTLYASMRRWGVRAIILHDHTPGERPVPSAVRLGVKRLLHRTSILSADRYVGVSDFVARRFVEVGGVPRERCAVVKNGVPAMPAQTIDIRTVLSLPEDARVVVSCGRAHRYKGIDRIIEMAYRLLSEPGYDDTYFVHIGDGPDLPNLRRMVRDRDLEDRFVLAGHRSDIRSLLPSCTLAVHASHGEAFSLAILEFMASGLPAIVPDSCGNSEAVEHGVSGALYPPGDVSRALHWIRKLLNDVELRRALARAALERARTEFTLEDMNVRFRQVVTPFIAASLDR